jgi:hypothetical protein
MNQFQQMSHPPVTPDRLIAKKSPRSCYFFTIFEHNLAIFAETA